MQNDTYFLMTVKDVTEIARNTYWSLVLRDSCDEDYVCYEQVDDEIFVDCVAVTLHRPAVQ